jgi:hypothetical protein
MRCRRPPILASAAAVVAFSLAAAGCGGGGSQGVASIDSSTTAATPTTQSGTTTTQRGTLASALAFARCMRSHGIPGWPDPTSGGYFDKATLRGLDLNVSRVRALESGPCNIPLPSPQQAYAITPAIRTDYLRGAACMRSHGYPDFPDPTFPDGSVRLDVPASIDTHSPRFRSAATICTRSIPAGLPYTRSSGS